MKTDISGYVAVNRDRLLNELKDLCRIPSVGDDPRALKEAAEMVTLRFRELGARVGLFELGEGPPLVYAELGAGPKTLLVYNHYDVQPPDPRGEWRADPFLPEIRDGRLWCRGSSDNKGNLMARIHALRACLETGAGLPLRLKFLVEGEEETGSAHLARCVREHADLFSADGCLWELSWKETSGRHILSCGVKGMCYVELRAKGADHDLHSSHASIVPNPAWRLVWALSTLLGTDYRMTLDGWAMEKRDLTGTEENAFRVVPFDEEGFKKIHGVPEFIRRLSGGDLVHEFLSAPTCTICGLRAGYTGKGSKTVLPSEAVAKLDFRLVPNMTPEKLLRALRRHLDERDFTDIDIQYLGGYMPATTDCGDSIVTAARAALREVSGEEPILYPVAPWSGPLHDVCGTLDIPSVAFGIGNEDSRDHAPNENIKLDDYFEGIRVMDSFMRIYSTI